ncbi:RidA family protein [Halalkalibacterium halodurans]|uniref:BH3085 protein n=1 Tax=Halalkalibacterium halodurans (strain ATCC BAA-125 / DSM 18197 / FERM 7344 / JCM 9153 / C-125) TaxID=272558 RepID=Q9K8C1_HALH5|nr:RidA family protein [Halalkalibacterium halodurans]MED4082068.1 RidA family protein [Halalkalibacterium halodurans]MED4084354.1 RidA family protein [Halalkalibacterium halodurans]MED4103663.1 RidA family protein [Halalkalibacterium halodurans]MED4107630.1 RidA family protein [Halalkalibacterium halodurans]MED4149079.1 RidA family protein [Halalkalibacterium halodurans]
MEIRKINPENLAAPIANYHHVAVIPRDAELVVLSGQIGNDKNGDLPTDIESQFVNALENIRAILHSEGVDLKNLFKINLWLTEDLDKAFFSERWNEFHGGYPPTTTKAFVSALARPEIKIEIEAWAAK